MTRPGEMRIVRGKAAVHRQLSVRAFQLPAGTSTGPWYHRGGGDQDAEPTEASVVNVRVLVMVPGAACRNANLARVEKECRNLAKAIERLIELDEQESRKQIERATYLSLADAVIEALPDALVVIDTTGKIVLVNKSAELMFGFHRTEMIGQPVEKLMPERVRSRHTHDREVYNRFDITQRSQTMGIGANLMGICKDGHEFPVDITLSRMVVPKGIYNLAMIRFSQKIIDLESATRFPPGPPSDRPRDLEASDAKR